MSPIPESLGMRGRALRGGMEARAHHLSHTAPPPTGRNQPAWLAKVMPPAPPTPAHDLTATTREKAGTAVAPEPTQEFTATAAASRPSSPNHEFMATAAASGPTSPSAEFTATAAASGPSSPTHEFMATAEASGPEPETRWMRPKRKAALLTTQRILALGHQSLAEDYYNQVEDFMDGGNTSARHSRRTKTKRVGRKVASRAGSCDGDGDGDETGLNMTNLHGCGVDKDGENVAGCQDGGNDGGNDSGDDTGNDSSDDSDDGSGSCGDDSVRAPFVLLNQVRPSGAPRSSWRKNKPTVA